ncbi:hypothetical protein CL630_01795 [bacterium]|nr:hypothetical protein [bacterium]|tara:strand:- start:19166 stop:19537 length:372 start_codon:yes stop_codon:yes gene_type:complete
MELDTQYFKQKLKEEKQLLEEELANLGHKNPDVPGDWEATPEKHNIDQEADKNLKADRIEEFEERSGIAAELENRLANVNIALKKIEDEKYGTCEIDSKPIEEDRLKANPAARTCKEHINEKI